ncbi:aminotransferase class V-fold PLP-dependent enzyme [Actinoplanes sp. NPDC048791]|uniref:aminotransferase class V-fold PLP-dependent enzyme n=1 Tax=Actinoplanes sp. NPDC048791 TaxID=3154623 RepID=UPI0033EAA911
MATDDVDYLALSGHKLYAPFGAGALVGRGDWLGAGEPFLAGGGAVRYVGPDTTLWALPFALRHVPYARLAAILSAEFAIGVRPGCFCAHPLMAALLHIDAAQDARLRDDLTRGVPTAIPGAVRASTGIGSTAADWDRFTTAVTTIATERPRWTFTSTPDGTDCRPTPDPRRLRLPYQDRGGRR